jgi:hypothetical protein
MAADFCIVVSFFERSKHNINKFRFRGNPMKGSKKQENVSFLMFCHVIKTILLGLIQGPFKQFETLLGVGVRNSVTKYHKWERGSPKVSRDNLFFYWIRFGVFSFKTVSKHRFLKKRHTSREGGSGHPAISLNDKRGRGPKIIQKSVANYSFYGEKNFFSLPHNIHTV